MSETNERIRTELQLENSTFLAALSAAGKETSEFFGALSLLEGQERKADAAAESLSDALARMSIDEMKLVEPVKQATAAIRQQQMTVGQVDGYKRLQESLGKTTEAGNKFGYNMVQWGQAVQDFQAAGFLGISNNLDRLAISLGLGAGVGGAIMIAGTMASQFGPSIKRFFTETFAGANQDIPKAVEAVDRLTKSLKDQKEELEKLEKQQKLTTDEADRYTRTQKNILEAEKELEKERKEKAERERVAKLKSFTENEHSRQIREDMEAAFGGQQGEIEKSVAGAVPIQYEAARKRLRKTAEGSPEHAAAFKEASRLHDMANDPNAIKDLIAKAFAGDEAALKQLIDLTGGQMRGQLEAIQPSTLDAQDKADEAFDRAVNIPGRNREKRRIYENAPIRRDERFDAMMGRKDRAFRRTTPDELATAQAAGATGNAFDGLRPAEWRKRHQAANERPVDQGANERLAPEIVAQQKQIVDAMWKGIISQAEGLAQIQALQSQINVVKREQERMTRLYQQNRRTHQNSGGP